MRITFSVNGSIDIEAKEVIELIREEERLEKEKFEHTHPSATDTAQPVEKVVPEANKEPWIGKMAKVNSRYNEQELEDIAYGDYVNPRKVIDESGNMIKLENDSDYWAPKIMFELVQDEAK